jgi:pimeloyl-ACP methyl ester carboxylesterase
MTTEVMSTSNLSKPDSSLRTLVLIHGALMNRNYWSRFDFDGLGYHRIISPNLWGHGDEADQLRSLSKIPRLSTYFLAEDVKNKCGLEDLDAQIQVTIIGHSLGGLVGLELGLMLAETSSTIKIDLVMGDSPIYMGSETDSQLAAKTQLSNTTLGQNLLRNAFNDFSSRHKDALYYEQKLISAFCKINVLYLAGTLGRHAKDKSSFIDCGTFLSNRELEKLASISDPNFSLFKIDDAGHFVFDSRNGTRKLYEILMSN